jgi:membrane AbrB-like protein
MQLPAAALAKLHPTAQWGLLVAGSALLALGLQAGGLPAALLLGPMIAAILAGTNGATIRVPRPPYYASQAIIGCLIAGSITPAIIGSFLRQWPLFLAVVLATLAASSLLGWVMSRWQVLPGTTAVWGSSPGAATAMMLMAEAFGADARLVAFMQYLRVVFVAVAASLIARLWVDPSGAARSILWFPQIDTWPFIETLGVAGIGAWVGRALRIPAGPLLVPMLVGAILHAGGFLAISLPQWLLAASYALLGWNIGLSFTGEVLARGSRALPQIILSILMLIAFCGALAFVLTKALGVDPLTAYLATSPGGMDSVAIIAASSKVDLSFVMALQTVRFIFVIFLGPPIARLIASWTKPKRSEG